jgi:zinc protease
MVFKGTETTPNIWGALEDHGADFNGTTWVDRTNYFETLPASDENLEFAIAMEADRMVNSLISEEDLAKEMTVVRNEFEMGENNPMRVLYQRMLATAYLWHNYGFDTIGNRSDIERVPAANLKAFYKIYYQPDNAMLVVAGKFDPDHALGLIQTHFGAIPRPARVLENTWTEEPVQDGARDVVLKRTGDVPVAGLMYHIPAGSHDDFAALKVLQAALTLQPSGRLYKALVEPGILANVEGETFAWAEPGVMTLWAQIAAGQAPEEALQKMEAIVEGAAGDPVSEEDVERIKTRLLKDIKIALTDSGNVGIELSEWAALGDWRLFFLHRDRLKAVTADEVNRVARAYLVESNRTSGLFLPTEAPVRAQIPPVPDVAALTEGYTGTETIATGEAFDPAPANIEGRTERGTLKSGLKFALLPKKTRGESIRLNLRLRGGDEASLTPWVTESAFLPAMFLRGTATLSHQALQDRIDTLQSKLTFSGGPGLLEVAVETDRAHLPDLLALLEDVLRNPALDAGEFEIERNEQLVALEEGLSDPQTLAMRAMARAARPFPRESIHYEPTQAERVEQLRGLTVERLREYFRTFCGGNFGEVAAVGDFDSAALKAGLERLLDNWATPRPYVRIALPYLPNLTGPERIETPDKQMAIVIRATAFELRDSDPRYPAFDFGLYILGQSAKSRLLNKLRHEGGLSYGAGAFARVDAESPGALLAAYAICKPDNARQALDVMRAAMDEWMASGVNSEELADGRESYVLQRLNQLADDGYVARELADTLEAGRTFTYHADLLAAIESLTVEQVHAALGEILGETAYREIVAGDLP